MIRKHKTSINQFLTGKLGLTLKSFRWSWDASNPGVVVMKLWEGNRDAKNKDRIEVWEPPPWEKPSTAARNERRESIDRIWAGAQAFAVIRAGNGRQDADPYQYDGDFLYRITRIEADRDDHKFAVLGQGVTIDEFLARPIDSRRLKIQASDLETLLRALGTLTVVTKNKDSEVEANFRPRPGHPTDMLDGKWTGEPKRMVPGRGFVLHLVEREKTIWLGEYRGCMPETGSRNSLIVGNAQCFEVPDLDLSSPDQSNLRQVLKQPGAVTYSYFGPKDWAEDEGDQHEVSGSLQGLTYRIAEVMQRLHQAAFRRAVFGKHGHRCIVTGCEAAELVEAAHLNGRSWVEGQNSADDGIPLRVDIHRAYDAGLIRLDERNRISYIADHLLGQYGHFRVEP